MKQLSILSLLLFFSVTIFGQIPQAETSTETVMEVGTPNMYHRARIYHDGAKGLLLLANQGLAVDHGKRKKGVYIESDFSENDIQKARMLGMQVDIIIEDIKNYYTERNKGLEKSDIIEKNGTCNGSSGVSYPTPANYNHGSMAGFLTLTELYQELDDMAALYPNLISVKAPISTFLTHENRPLYWIRMSDNPNVDETEPEVLYTSIHHAREPESMQQLVYYMWYMLENYATNDEIKGILDNTELYFIPMVNPDGYQHNVDNNPNGLGYWRKNKRNLGGGNYGVDNNRNYDYIDGNGNSIWGTSGVSFDPTQDNYPGTGPFSEPENQAMKWFAENHNFKIALNNHSYGDLLLYPFGYANNQLTVDNSTFVAISGMMVAQNTMANVISASLYPAAGDSDDWMYGETSTHNKIYAFTPEIGGSSDGFWPAINRINPIAESMVHLNLTTAHLATNYAEANDLSASVISDLNGSFYYDITRLGLEDPANFTVSIIPISTNILTVGTANSHNSMVLLQQDNDSISYTLDPNIVTGDLLTYVLSVDNGQYLSNDTITKTYGQTQIIFSEAADDVNNWTVSSSWGTTTSAFYSASSSITDSPGGNYNNNISKSITLTSGVDLNNAIAANLSFYGKWDIEDNFDFVQLEISTDGGSSWIPQCGKYTNMGVSDQIEGEPLYDGVQATWVKEEINLSDYLGQNIIARFTIIADGGVTKDGFYYDDFEITVVYDGTGIEEMTSNGLYISQNIPNPSNESTIINYVLPQSTGIAYLNITNGMGQVIDKIILSNSSQNVQISTSHLAQGVYYYYIESSEQRSLTKKMIVVKR